VNRGANRHATPVAIRMTESVLMTAWDVEESGCAEELLSALGVAPSRGSIALLGGDTCAMWMS
jgi:hypothetical protein